MTRWRLLVDGAGEPAWNLAVDEVLLHRYLGGDGGPPTLRLYGWTPPALSLGHRQPPQAPAVPGVVLVRRPTGGQAVLHEDERTYAVAGALRRPPFPGGVLDTYARIAAALLAGLRRLGLEAEAASPASGGAAAPPFSCFEDLSGHEISWRGRKLVGSAQLRRRRGFLQHGSLPRSLPPARLSAVMGEPVREERFTDLARALGRTPADGEIDRALVAGFEEAFGCTFAADALTAGEREAAQRLSEGKRSAP